MDIGACTNAQVDITQLHNCTFQLQSYKGGCIPHKICIEIAHANIHRGYDEVISAISAIKEDERKDERDQVFILEKIMSGQMD